MNSSARPSSRRSAGQQLEHGGLDGDVERAGDLVADQHVGPRGQRAGDRDALALAAGELAGEARSARRAGQAHALQQLADLRPAASRRDRPRRTPRGPRDRVADALARVERVVRVLEDDLDAAPGLARAVPGHGPRAAAPSSRMRPPEGACSPATQRAIVVLPQPDSPTSARHSPRCERRTTRRRPPRVVVGAASRSPRAGPRPPAARASAARAAPARSAARSTTRAAACAASRSSARAWPRPRPRTPAAAPRADLAAAAGSAARRRSPAGARPTPTATPGMPLQPPRHGVVGDRGDEAARVRVARRAQQLLARAPPRRRARRTSRRRGRRSGRPRRGRG